MKVVVETVAEQPIAAVIARVPMGQIGAHFRPHLDKVYAFLKTHDDVRLPGAHMSLSIAARTSTCTRTASFPSSLRSWWRASSPRTAR
jgi:hypothetical protein